MKFYFGTRHTLVALVLSGLIASGMLLLPKLLVVTKPSDYLLFSPSVPLQILIVGVLSLSLSGRSEQFEFVGVRKLALFRLLNSALLTTVGAALAIAVSAVLGMMSDESSGTVGQWAQVRAFIGLFGITLFAASFIDMRLAALLALPFIFVGFAFDIRTMMPPLGEALGFVLADSGSMVSWITAGMLLVLGLLSYMFFYSERNSPSLNRRALLDARRRFQRN